MIKFIFIFLLPFTLFGSKILSYNIYDRTDRVDVMITFDTPYNGVIKQSSSKSKIIIKLEDASIESSKIKRLSSKFLHSLTITPMAGYTQIVAYIPSSVKLKASKTSDAYGLRLRFTNKTTAKKDLNKVTKNSLDSLPTKKDDENSQRYFIVIFILIIGIGVLIYLRKKVIPQQKSDKINAWSFKENQTNTPIPTNDENENVTIRFQKTIDSKNSVIMLDFGEQSFLVLMGNSNILLEKYTDDKPTSQEDFETILQNRHQELDQFLKVEETPKDPMQAYKERAASIMYEAQ